MITPERFFARVAVGGPDECWPWLGVRRRRDDYGNVGNNVLAHRLAYTFRVGPIPAGLHVLHHCDNPPCCNPAHLFVGTQADNNADMWSKGRGSPPPHPEGEAHGRAVLTEKAVAAIRGRRRHESSEVLARDYGVSGARIRQVRRGDGRRMVNGESEEAA